MTFFFDRSPAVRRARGRWAWATVLVLVLTLAGTATAGGAFAGTLDRIGRDKMIRIAFREDAPPFSYKDQSGAPAGYMVDLCRAVAKTDGPAAVAGAERCLHSGYRQQPL